MPIVFRLQSPPDSFFAMPTSPHISPPQSPVTETTNDHPLIVTAAETPEQPQGGTLPDSPMPGGLQPSATIESLPDAFDSGPMPENATRNGPSSPAPRTANTQARPGSGRHPIRIVPDPPRPGQTGTQNQNQQSLSIPGRILVFLGYGRGNRARKELVSVIFSVVIDVSQVSIQLTFRILCP